MPCNRILVAVMLKILEKDEMWTRETRMRCGKMRIWVATCLCIRSKLTSGSSCDRVRSQQATRQQKRRKNKLGRLRQRNRDLRYREHPVPTLYPNLSQSA
ncbi:hypothetical protein KC19_6G158200 [Ceratodon purpureus]|uniref:Uncharacterized protein n=1 Tax=Ceratodon purpureus TaxID=3225 RepID=A0A8T0HF25_CERPU|nr:hypothetical protein KC19_6G158200 [Ceratodon purpureus]